MEKLSTHLKQRFQEAGECPPWKKKSSSLCQSLQQFLAQSWYVRCYSNNVRDDTCNEFDTIFYFLNEWLQCVN